MVRSYASRSKGMPKLKRRNGSGNYRPDATLWNSRNARENRARPCRVQANIAHLTQAITVGTQVEYDLPSHIYPPKNAGHILMIDTSQSKKVETSPPRINTFLDPSSISSRQSYSGSNNTIKLNNLRRNGSSRSSRANKQPVIIDLAASPTLPEPPIAHANNNANTYYSQSPIILNKDTARRRNTPANVPSFNSSRNDVVDDSLISQTNLLGLQYRDQYQQQENIVQKRVESYRKEQLRQHQLLQEEERQQRMQHQEEPQVQQQQDTQQAPPPSYATAMAHNYSSYAVPMTPMTSSNLSRTYQFAEPMSPTGASYRFESNFQKSKSTTSPIMAAQAVFSAATKSALPEGTTLCTPLIGAVPPDMVPPHAISTAHIVRSRGSPKLKCSKRNAAATGNSSLHNYHRQRPRSNTVGHVGFQKSSGVHAQSAVAMDLSSKFNSVAPKEESQSCAQITSYRLPISPVMSMEEDSSSRSPSVAAASDYAARRSGFSAVDTLCSNSNSPDYLGVHNIKNSRNNTSTSNAIKTLLACSAKKCGGAKVTPNKSVGSISVVGSISSKANASNGVKTPSKRGSNQDNLYNLSWREEVLGYDAGKTNVSIHKVMKKRADNPPSKQVSSPPKLVEHSITGYQISEEAPYPTSFLHNLLGSETYLAASSPISQRRSTNTQMLGIPTPPATNLTSSQQIYPYHYSTPDRLYNRVHSAMYNNMVC